MKISQDSMTRAASGAVSGADRLIRQIPEQTQVTIKGLFFLLIFGCVIGGVVWGITAGKESAKIKSAPIIENTNEAFDLDIKREKEDGNFTAMLDSEKISEMKKIDMEKVKFPSQTNLEPDIEKGVIEPEMHRKIKESPEVRVQDPLFEGDYGKKPEIRSDVRPIEKRSGGAVKDRESMIDNEQKDLPRIKERNTELAPGMDSRDSVTGPPARKRTLPLPEDGTSILEEGKKEISPALEGKTTRSPALRKPGPDVRPLQIRKRSGGIDVRSPEPLNHDEGIIGD
jgi:hypothetical protein